MLWALQLQEELQLWLRSVPILPVHLFRKAAIGKNILKFNVFVSKSCWWFLLDQNIFTWFLRPFKVCFMSSFYCKIFTVKCRKQLKSLVHSKVVGYHLWAKKIKLTCWILLPLLSGWEHASTVQILTRLELVRFNYGTWINECIRILVRNVMFVWRGWNFAYLVATCFNIGHGNQRKVSISVSIGIHRYRASNSCSLL